MNSIENVRARDIHAAADFVAAQPGGPDRLLDRHRRMPDGSCASCVATPTPWPCIAVVIADLATRLLTTGRQPPPCPTAPASEEPLTSPTTGAVDGVTHGAADRHRRLPVKPVRRQPVRWPRTRRHS